MIRLTQRQLDARLDGGAVAARDLRGTDLSGLSLAGRRLEGVVFGGGDPAVLDDLDLRDAQLVDCDLRGVTLQRARLQRARFVDCDLRYTVVERTSFKQTELRGCDLYRARLGPGTVFEDAALTACSFNRVDLDGVFIEAAQLDGALVQEDVEAFRDLHRRVAERPGPTDGDPELLVAERRLEAAGVLRRFSGYWSGTGQLRDASWAYVRARRLETAHLAPWRVWARHRRGGAPGARPTTAALRSLPAWLGGTVAGSTSGHGERPLRVVTTAFVLVLAAAVLLTVLDVASVDGAPVDSFDGGLLLAVQAMTSTLPGGLELSRVGSWIVVVETGVGIVLLGLFGFVLGNRIRNA